MKIRNIVFILFTIIVFVTGCGSESVGTNSLFDEVQTDTAIKLRVFDGENYTEYRLSKRAEDVELPKKLAGYTATLSKKTAHDLDPTKKHPIYELSMYTSTGDFVAAYCDGLLVLTDGTAYDYGFDFAKLLTEYNFQKSDYANDFLASRYWYALDGGHFDKNHLQKLGDIVYLDVDENVPGISLEFGSVEEKDGKLFVNSSLTNSGNEEFIYGESFYLEVKLDDVWYFLPTRPDRQQFFKAIAYVLQTGQTAERTDSLDAYSPLPAGNYRITLAKGISAEFAID